MDVELITCGKGLKKKRTIEHMVHRKNKRPRRVINAESSDEENEEEITVDPTHFRDMIRAKMGDLFGKENDHAKGKCNHLYFDEDITKHSCRRLICKIDELNIKLGKLACDFDIDVNNPVKIYLHINSFGGSIFSAFSVIDAMRRSKYPIVTIVEGASASAATLISVCGHERWITRHGYMLIHQLSSACWGKMTEIEDEYDNLKELMEQIYKIYEEKTHLTRPQLRKILKHDRWWGAEQCLESGLVDKII